MMGRRLLTVWFAVVSCVSVLLATPCGSASAPSLVVVVVGPEAPFKDVSSAELRRVFLRTTDGVDGNHVLPLNHPARTELRVRFDRAILGMSAAEVGRYWIDRRIRGEIGPPPTVDNPALLRRVVARLPGAITYMRVDHVDDTVRVLTIDGRAPGEAGYPLK